MSTAAGPLVRDAIDPSLADRAFVKMVASSAAPPSFDGQGWLVALNLFAITAGCCLMLMLAGKIARDMWRNRYRDKIRDLVTILRLAMLAFCCANVLRFGGEAAVLWGWTRPTHMRRRRRRSPSG